MRLDRFLTRARLIKHRTEAQRQIAAGLVLQNGGKPKPAHAVRPGDRLFIRYLGFDLEVEVLRVPPVQVSKAEAAGLVRVVARLPRETS